MRKVSVVVFCLFVSLLAFAQNDQVLTLVEQGIELHQQGRYDEALDKYNKALEIDPNSALVNYEMSYTYFMMGDYPNAIIHSQRVLDFGSDLDFMAYVVLGSSLNMSGNPLKAIETFELAIAQYPYENLLHYNHALTCYQQGLYHKAKDSAINGIRTRPGHASSHLILAYSMKQLGERIKAMLPLYLFLYLEPGTNRSYEAYTILDELIFKGVEKTGEKNINLTISRSDDSTEFAALEMFVSLVAASRYTEEKQVMNDLEFFASFNESFFSMLNLGENESTSFWHEFYVPFLTEIKSDGHAEAFSYFVLQSVYPELVMEWIEDNPDKLEDFFLWTEAE